MEDLIVEELADASGDDWLLQDLCDGQSFSNIDDQKLRNESFQLARKVSRQSWILATHDLHAEVMHAGTFEGRSERAELVEHDTKGPYVTLEGVRPTFDDLWREVVWRAYHGTGHFDGVSEHSCDAEITQFDDVLSRQEYVLAFDITMQDLPVVHVLHA